MSEWLDQLDEIAEAATPGPWERLAGDYGRRVACQPARVLFPSGVHTVARVESKHGQHHHDAAYLATFSPPVVRNLIERARRLERVEQALGIDTTDAVLDGMWARSGREPEQARRADTAPIDAG